MAAARKATTTVLDQPVPRGVRQVSLGAFGYLFSELVQYCQKSVMNIQDLERKLAEAGHSVGFRFLELVIAREKPGKRDVKVLQVLQTVSSTMWKAMFGKAADALEKSRDNDDEYMIAEKEPIANQFISVPAEFGHLNCASFVAGIIGGILDGSGFPARVTAHFVSTGPSTPDKTVFLIKFSREALAHGIS